MKLSIKIPLTYPKERKYIVDVIFRIFLGIDVKIIIEDRSNTLITFDNGNRLILPDILFQLPEEKWLTPDSLPKQPLQLWDVDSLGCDYGLTFDTIPVIYGVDNIDKTGVSCIQEQETIITIRLPIDILGSAFFMLTRYEEVVCKIRDPYDRFPATASIAYQECFLDRPIIDEYVQLLWKSIKRLWPGIVRKPYSAPAIRLSHDVDAPSRYALGNFKRMMVNVGADVVRRKINRSLFIGPRAYFFSHNELDHDDPYNNFEWIMDLSERHGLNSAFYFVAGWTDPKKQPNYSINMPAIRKLLRRIHSRGHEIGLHPSFNTYNAPDLLVAEADRLKGICAEENITQDFWGGRMHWLRWKTPTTLYGWEKAKMTYDNTLAYADIAGFRCGTCREYPAFDPVKAQQLKLCIRPLIAMEGTVIGKKYMGLGLGENAYEYFHKLKRACLLVDGTFTLLWHNSKLRTNDERLLLKAVLDA